LSVSFIVFAVLIVAGVGLVAAGTAGRMGAP
jgi:hypothetical protein